MYIKNVHMCWKKEKIKKEEARENCSAIFKLICTLVRKEWQIMYVRLLNLSLATVGLSGIEFGKTKIKGEIALQTKIIDL